MPNYKKLLTQPAQPLAAHRVPMPELKGVFEEGEEEVFFVSTLTALEKDQMDAAVVAYKERNGLTDDQANEIYRVFCVAYCLCDADNVRQVQPDKVRELDAMVEMVGSLPNNLVKRLWANVNGANSILGVEDDLAKKSQAQAQNPKSTDSSGDGQST